MVSGSNGITGKGGCTDNDTVNREGCAGGNTVYRQCSRSWLSGILPRRSTYQQEQENDT